MQNISEFELSINNIDKMLNIDFMKASLDKGHGLFQDALSVSNELLLEYYKAAYRLVEAHRWEDAQDAFTFLTFLNPYVYDFWIGLGNSQQSQEAYEKAIFAYSMAEMLNPENPTSYANAFQCHQALGNKENSEACIRTAIKYCGDSEEWAELKKRLEKFTLK